MSKSYIFDAEDAMKYGVDAAIVLHAIKYWIEKNKANEKHFHDGRYWTYNSKRAWAELFPFFSARQVRRILDGLVKQGVLVTANYNSSPLDRTLWYALTDMGSSIVPKTANGLAELVSPIPDNIPDNIHNPFTNTKVFEFPQGERCVSERVCTSCPDAQQWDTVVKNWNQLAERWKLPKVMCLSARRKRAFMARVKDVGSAEKFFEIVGTALKESPFLCGLKLVGGNGEYTWEKTDWQANFDFFLQKSSFIKAMEGGYKDAAYRK